MESASSKVVRFGVFEIDFGARELRKRGVRVKLQDQPFRVLEALLEKPGEIVTREQLKDRLWAEDEFVEFDKSLNTSVQKIRQALGDSAESPRFLETVPKIGYRFVAPVEMQAMPASASDQREGTAPTAQRNAAVATAVVVGAIVLTALVWNRANEDPPTPPRLRKFTVAADLTSVNRPVPSPDGRYLACRHLVDDGRVYGDVQLWDYATGSWKSAFERKGSLFWSPNSQSLGLASKTDIVAVDIRSGAERTLTAWPDKPSWFTNGSSWSQDGRSIVFSAGPTYNELRLYRVAAAGGGYEALFEPGAEDPDRTFGFFDPYFLPDRDGRQAMVYAEGVIDSGNIGIIDLDTGDRRTLVESERPLRYPVYSTTGHVVYQESPGHAVEAGERLWALPFSLDDLSPTGEAFVVAERARWPGVSEDGTLTYLGIGSPGNSRLAWRDRTGRTVGRIGAPQDTIQMPVLSPDGDQVVVRGWENGVSDIWVHEVGRPVKRRLTFDEMNQDRPTWRTVDEVSFSSSSLLQRPDVYITAADGSGEARLLFGSAQDGEFGYEWTRDGKCLVGSGGGWLWYVRESGDKWEKFTYADDRFDHVSPELSPDGRYLAYESDETGTSEVWVRPFPEGDGKWLVSTNGGVQPRWQGDGSELFYVEGDTLMATPVTFEPVFEIGEPRPLFKGYGVFAGRGQQYDVSADGQRFVVVEDSEPQEGLTIHVVLNWYEEFRDREQD